MSDDAKPIPNPAPQPPIEPQWLYYVKWSVWLAAVVGAIGTFLIEWNRTQTLPPLPDIPPLPVEVHPVGQGWVHDPAEVDAVLKAMPKETRFFRDTPAGKAVFGDEEDVFLWKAAVELTGSTLPVRNQGGVGSCVSFGTASAIEHLLLNQIVRDGKGQFHPLAQEVIYGGSRVEVGGGRIRGDGSVGAWAAKWVKDWGVVSRGVHGSHDLSSYSESTCRLYGSRGVPDDLEPLAKESPVKGVTLVSSAAEAKKALRQGYPIAVCSDQGFSMTRDADGFAAAQGTWYHCMAILGYQAGSRPGFYILNSWGPNAHRGPTGAGDPGTGGFWADERIVNRMLMQGDSWAFSDAVGFPSRKLDWFKGADARRRPAVPPFELALAP